MKTPWQHLKSHPPVYCFLLARQFARRDVKTKHVVAMSLQEVAIGAGMPLARVQQISLQTSWDGVTITEAERFLAGCNFDPLSSKDRNRKKAYTRTCKTRTSKWLYLRRSPHWKTEFEPRIKLLKSLQSSLSK